MAGRLRAPTGRYGGKSAAQRQAERRRRFLDAALQLFGDSPGYRATTVAALSEAAGLSTRQFYEEFRTLEDVLAALHLQVNAWAEEAVRTGGRRSEQALPQPQVFDGQVLQVIAVHLHFPASGIDDPRPGVHSVERHGSTGSQNLDAVATASVPDDQRRQGIGAAVGSEGLDGLAKCG